MIPVRDSYMSLKQIIIYLLHRFFFHTKSSLILFWPPNLLLVQNSDVLKSKYFVYLCN